MLGGGHLAEQLQQALPFVLFDGGMEDQLAGGLLVIADQRPGVQAKARVGQMQIIPGAAGQRFEVAAEIVAQVTDQAPGERQFEAGGQFGTTQLRQGASQAREECLAAFVRQYRQLFQWPGAEQVVAPALGSGE